MTYTKDEQVDCLSQAVTFPCGITAQNRLAKAPMEEIFSFVTRDPNHKHFNLYRTWAKANWGIIFTSNVMVSSSHLGTPGDIVLPDPQSPSYQQSLDAFSTWATAAHGSPAPPDPSTSPSKPIAIMQLCHNGRQSMRGFGRPFFQPPLAPSAIRVDGATNMLEKLANTVVFQTPKAMLESDIDQVVENFVYGARVAKESGFDGVELHASHGYLLAQFMSPRTNLRIDSYGGSSTARNKLLFRIIDDIRKLYPSSTGFCLGVKLNSSDYVKGGLNEEDALKTVKNLALHGGVDFIDISGGSYENPIFMQEGQREPKPPTYGQPNAREAFFQVFARQARSTLAALPASSLPSGKRPLIMVTGGLRTRKGMAEAVLSSSADLVGIARPACVDPHLPLKILDRDLERAGAPVYEIRGASVFKKLPIGLLLPGISTMFHTVLLAKIGQGLMPDHEINFFVGVWQVWIWPLICYFRWKILLILAGWVACLWTVYGS
ncbi:FMN-linked oxidoreductase [Meredithblackwellia eburnea MCA 4105]